MTADDLQHFAVTHRNKGARHVARHPQQGLTRLDLHAVREDRQHGQILPPLRLRSPLTERETFRSLKADEDGAS